MAMKDFQGEPLASTIWGLFPHALSSLWMVKTGKQTNSREDNYEEEKKVCEKFKKSGSFVDAKNKISEKILEQIKYQKKILEHLWRLKT